MVYYFQITNVNYVNNNNTNTIDNINNNTIINSIGLILIAYKQQNV